MDGLGQTVGNGITALVAGAFDAVGSVLRGIVNAGNQALPNGLFFVLLLIGGWTLAKRRPEFDVDRRHRCPNDRARFRHREN